MRKGISFWKRPKTYGNRIAGTRRQNTRRSFRKATGYKYKKRNR